MELNSLTLMQFEPTKIPRKFEKSQMGPPGMANFWPEWDTIDIYQRCGTAFGLVQ